MADKTIPRLVCAECGLAFRNDERRLPDFREPPSLRHEPGVCARRLLDLLDDVRERAARTRAGLRDEISATMVERDEARRDLAAARVVVRAARILRVRRWQRDRAAGRMVVLCGSASAVDRAVVESAWKAAYELRTAERALDAALVAGVLEVGR